MFSNAGVPHPWMSGELSTPARLLGRRARSGGKVCVGNLWPCSRETYGPVLATLYVL